MSETVESLPNSTTVRVYLQRRDQTNDVIKNADYYTVPCAIETTFTLLCVKTQQRTSEMDFWVLPFKTALNPNFVAVVRREKRMCQTCYIGFKVKDIHFRLISFIENHLGTGSCIGFKASFAVSASVRDTLLDSKSSVQWLHYCIEIQLRCGLREELSLKIPLMNGLENNRVTYREPIPRQDDVIVTNF